jgi:transcriptional regulator with XRE-family HTH domain
LNDNEKKQKQIQLLQQNLRSIRQIAGWTAEQFGEKIGVTKQTIGDLENKKRPMNLTQYLAIRSILNEEIKSSPENANVLQQVIEILVDKGTELEEENYIEIKDTVETVAASASKGKKGAPLAKLLITLLTSPEIIGAITSLGIMISQTGTGTTSGLKKLK